MFFGLATNSLHFPIGMVVLFLWHTLIWLIGYN